MPTSALARPIYQNIARPLTGPATSAPTHVYDMTAPGGYTPAGAKVATLHDLGTAQAVDFVQANDLLRPGVGPGPVAQLNGAEYMTSGTGLVGLINSGKLQINIKLRFDSVVLNNGVFMAGPASGHGYFEISGLTNGRIRVAMRTTTPVTLIKDYGIDGLGGAGFSAGVDYEIAFAFHDGILDYSRGDGVTAPVVKSTGVAFDLSGQDAAYNNVALGARYGGGAFSSPFNGSIKSLTIRGL